MTKKGGKLRSPFLYFGGKGMLAKTLEQYIPNHKNYIEPFAGGASLFWRKSPSLCEVLNDIDPKLMDFYFALQSREGVEKLIEFVALCPYSRRLYRELKNQHAGEWFIRQTQCFSGSHSWSYSVSIARKNKSLKTSSVLSKIALLPLLHSRLQNVTLLNGDYRDAMETVNTAETFAYLDPPYVHGTRRSGGYKHEMTDGDHEALVDYLLSFKGQVLLSGYDCKIYDRLKWEQINFKWFCSAAKNVREARREVLWKNY